ncbi:hypothetical protein FX988_02964 [Paraglaciecola mesophila]|uniref:Uncharacterized protein n=1 Tax=Paraglaciecola mesophila TaxID=197222 RepID=A0A857JMG5_9ALTE|nr:hypothetical protein [Paraglaciecola mesophila]QHJ12706.1 hypothetical protein FX988_02964 [Paraglaciecola mesophila]
MTDARRVIQRKGSVSTWVYNVGLKGFTVTSVSRVFILLIGMLNLGCYAVPEKSALTLNTEQKASEGKEGEDGVKAVDLRHGVDQSAGGLSAYIVTISNATFYLEKEGGGLSSMLDSDGVDWIGFHNVKGSGWKGEYRGFPNAVHKQDGSYFHAMNAGTEPSTSRVTIETREHVQIIFTSGNSKWQASWDFYPDRCDFTMTKVSPGYHYWVQYEGVPGGLMDESDFWYNSADNQRHPINESFSGDLPSPEWFAFGDTNAPRMLYLLHHEDNLPPNSDQSEDTYPDDYVSRPYMTVLGFGRSNKDKFLNTPQRFSLGFVESTAYESLEKTVRHLIAQ